MYNDNFLLVNLALISLYIIFMCLMYTQILKKSL